VLGRIKKERKEEWKTCVGREGERIRGVERGCVGGAEGVMVRVLERELKLKLGERKRDGEIGGWE